MTGRGELFERAPTAMIVVDDTLAVIDANDAAARLLGDALLEECVAPDDLYALRGTLDAAEELATAVHARCAEGDRVLDVEGTRLDDGSWLLSLHARRERPREPAWERLLARVEPSDREGARQVLELLRRDPGAMHALIADAAGVERGTRARTGARAAARPPARRLRVAS